MRLELFTDGVGIRYLFMKTSSDFEFDINRDTISWIRRKIEYRRSLMEHLAKKIC